MNISEKIARMMYDRNWTTYDLSQRSGLRQSTIASIVSNRTTPNFETLSKICNGFNVTLSDFFDEGITPPPETIDNLYNKLPDERKKLLIKIAETFSE